MEIYLKHRSRKQFLCIKKEGKGSIELDIMLSNLGNESCVSIYEDEQPDERHSYYSSKIEKCWVNGKYTPEKAWSKSNELEFKEAYKQLTNELYDFKHL